LSILEEKISQVNLKASDILSAILDMNWVNIDKKNIPSCLQALENYVSRK